MNKYIRKPLTTTNFSYMSSVANFRMPGQGFTNKDLWNRASADIGLLAGTIADLPNALKNTIRNPVAQIKKYSRARKDIINSLEQEDNLRAMSNQVNKFKEGIRKEGVIGVTPRREVDGLAPYDKRFNLDKYPERIPSDILGKAATYYNEPTSPARKQAIETMWKAQKDFQ